MRFCSGAPCPRRFPMPSPATTSPASSAAATAVDGLSVEQRALLACLRAPLSQAEAQILRGMCACSLDWDVLIELAKRHRVQPLVFWNLQAVGWAGVPASTREKLSGAFHIHASHTFALARELLHVGSLLQRVGVPMVSLKGPTLALSAYGSVALRQFGDLDVLVPRSQVLRARRALHEDGYRSRLELAKAQEEAHLRDDSVFDLVRDEGLDGRPTALELHWGLTGRAFTRPIAFDHVHLRLREGPLVGGVAQHLDAPDLLLILCVHGTKHLWERLQWITDVSQVLRQYASCDDKGDGKGQQGELDWNRVRGLAVRFRVERMVGLGLVLAHDVLEAPLPPQVLAWARALPRVEVLATQVRAGLFTGHEPSEAQSALASSRFLMRAMDSWRDRARFALHVLTTPPAEERAALALPGSLERLRPLVRPASLAAAHLKHAQAARKKRGA